METAEQAIDRNTKCSVTIRARDRDSGARCAPADRTDRLHRPDPSFSGRSRRSNVRDFQYSGSYVDVGAPVPSNDTMVNEHADAICNGSMVLLFFVFW